MHFLTLLIIGIFSNLSIAQSPEPDHDSGGGVELILSPDGRTELIFRSPEEVKEKRRREEATWEALPQSAKLQKCLGQYQQEFGSEDPDNAYFWGNENSLYSFSDKGIEKTKIPVEAWKKLENFKGRDKNAPAVWAELSVKNNDGTASKRDVAFLGKMPEKGSYEPLFLDLKKYRGGKTAAIYSYQKQKLESVPVAEAELGELSQLVKDRIVRHIEKVILEVPAVVQEALAKEQQRRTFSTQEDRDEFIHNTKANHYGSAAGVGEACKHLVPKDLLKKIQDLRNKFIFRV